MNDQPRRHCQGAGLDDLRAERDRGDPLKNA
jgi:hypothetical protein